MYPFYFKTNQDGREVLEKRISFYLLNNRVTKQKLLKMMQIFHKHVSYYIFQKNSKQLQNQIYKEGFYKW